MSTPRDETTSHESSREVKHASTDTPHAVIRRRRRTAAPADLTQDLPESALAPTVEFAPLDGPAEHEAAWLDQDALRASGDQAVRGPLLDPAAATPETVAAIQERGESNLAFDALPRLPRPIPLPVQQRRHRWRVAAAVALFVGLVMGLLGGVWWHANSDSDEQTSGVLDAIPGSGSALGNGEEVEAAAATGAPDGWALKFSDEFDGGSLDTSKWTPEHSTFGDANRELECHTPDNIAVRNGTLVITAKKQTVTCPGGSTRKYTSGLIRSKDKFATAFGRFEMRAKLPAGKGLWPAFWMLSQDYPYGGKGRSGEIDIMEMLGQQPQKIVGTTHWSYTNCGWGCSRYGAEYFFPAGSNATSFHTYAVEWEPRSLRWLVDGKVYLALGDNQKRRWSSEAENPTDGSATYPAPFNSGNAMYMLINLSVGGNWAGSPDASTPFPSSMVVDWVRVYKRPGQ